MTYIKRRVQTTEPTKRFSEGGINEVKYSGAAELQHDAKSGIRADYYIPPKQLLFSQGYQNEIADGNSPPKS